MSAQFKVSVSTTELKVVVKSVGISNGNGGSGDVSGPGSSSSGNIATFSSNTGKAIQDSGQSLSALVSSVAGKETAGAADDAIAAHVGAADPHPQYTTAAELSASVAAGLAKVAPRVGFYIGPASDANSATYDYTTDGTADEVQINAALAAIGGNYGVVFLMPGTYTISNCINQPSKARIHLADGALIQPANGYTPTSKIIDGVTYRCLITNSDHTSGNSEIVISGKGKITAPASRIPNPNTAAGPSFSAVLWNKVTESLIEQTKTSDILRTISGSELTGVRQYALGLFESHRNVIRGCEMDGCGNDNISIRRDSSNNIVEGVIGQDSLYGHAVGQVSSGSGIFGGTAGGNASGNRWINCTGIGDLATATIATAAIVNHGGFNNSIESCLSVNCGVGFVNTGNSQNSGIKNCQVVNPKYYGIWMRTDSSGTNLNNKISDCIVTMSSDTVYGVLFEATGSGFDCKKCSLDNVKVIGTDGVAQNGIGIITNTVAPGTNGGEVSDLVITNPQITNCGASGIYIDTKNSSGVIGRVFIQGGEIRDCLNGIRAGAITTPGLVTNFTVNGTVINSSVASSKGIELIATSGWSCDSVRIRVSGVAISDDASSSANRFTFCDTSSSGTPTPSLSGLGSTAIDLVYGKTGNGGLVLSDSPTLTGTPEAPTATVGTNTTQVATTAFVQAAVVASGGGDALTTNPLSQFASTTSAQLAGVISDETGSSGGGVAVFNNQPNFTNGFTVGGNTNRATFGGIDVASGGLGFILGADASATSRTTNTTKVARIGAAPYDNSALPMCLMIGSPGASSSILAIGGGSSLFNAATQIDFYTASSITGGAGTSRLTIPSTGIINIPGSLTLGTALAVAQGGTGATTAKAAFDNLNGAEATIASATTTDIGAASSDKVSITGTTTITGFGTAAAGVVRKGRFTGALALTHNATSLILPGGANITTVAGDRFEAVSLGSGNWVVYSYEYATHTGTGAPAHANSPSFTTPSLGVASATSVNKWAFTSPATAATLTAGGDGLTYTLPGETCNVGYREIPQNSQSAAYTCVLADNGKHIYHPSADTTARTWTIPANASVAYPVGTTLTFINDSSAGTITISITTDTLVLAGTGSTGSRTLAANGIATATKITSTRWIINGTGLT